MNNPKAEELTAAFNYFYQLSICFDDKRHDFTLNHLNSCIQTIPDKKVIRLCLVGGYLHLCVNIMEYVLVSSACYSLKMFEG